MTTLQKIKEEGQDFEWYPTTKEILRSISKDIPEETESILDIGAGNGNALLVLEELRNENSTKDYIFTYKKYGIEKSGILRNEMPPEIFILGTDFHQQTLIDKSVDVVFCNPPYSEYEEWMIKTINEVNCKNLYLVVPERWKDNKLINEAIEKRNVTPHSLGNFSFYDSEYRKARVVVDVLSITIQKKYSRDSVDPFSVWFNDAFEIKASRPANYSSKERIRKNTNAIIEGRTLIEVLTELYSNDLNNLMENYKAISSMDSVLLEELGVNRSSIMESLKMKISGLKNAYWNELFDNFDMITKRLTKKRRGEMLSQLTQNTGIDFNADNAFAVALWVIKNANKYFDLQLLEVYDEWTSKKNTKGYKSNKHWTEDGWKYEEENGYYTQRYQDSVFMRDNGNYSLDYRLVMELYQALNFSWSGECRGLSINAIDHISDIFVIAGNLGFEVTTAWKADYVWVQGSPNKFYTKDKLFCEIKAHKKGTLHIKFCKEFIQKFNVEAGRLKGWIKNPTQASEEMGINISVANEVFNSNIQISKNDVKLLGIS